MSLWPSRPRWSWRSERSVARRGCVSFYAHAARAPGRMLPGDVARVPRASSAGGGYPVTAVEFCARCLILRVVFPMFGSLKVLLRCVCAMRVAQHQLPRAPLLVGGRAWCASGSASAGQFVCMSVCPCAVCLSAASSRLLASSEPPHVRVSPPFCLSVSRSSTVRCVSERHQF